jgi:DNA helicase HerA-like ATPase
MYILGRTGMGKSTLLETLIASDIEAGNGFALLDPHGDLAETVHAHAEARGLTEVIAFNPTAKPLGYNALRVDDPSRRYHVVSGIISAFRNIWSDFWGPRMEHVLRHALMTLAEFPGAAITDIPRLLADVRFRASVVGRTSDDIVRSFWRDEFERYSPHFRNEVIAPILNKIGAVLASPEIRAVVGDRAATLNLRSVMDSGRIFVANLSKGRLGDDAARLLGALLVSGFEQAALSRVDAPEASRRDFYLYLDECHNFATRSLITALQETRKYRLAVVMASQYLEQLDEEMQKAILGNVGSLVAFRVGVRDARILADEFFPEFSVEDLVNLSAHHIYLRLMINGAVSRGFSAVTISPLQRTETQATPADKLSTERV